MKQPKRIEAGSGPAPKRNEKRRGGFPWGSADLFFPPDLYCISCGAVIDGTRRYALCDACIRRFGWVGPRTCAKCGKILPEESVHGLCHDCRTIRHAFDRGFTCASYGLYERMLIGDYKEKGRTHLCRRIGEIMADRWLIEMAGLGESAEPGGPETVGPGDEEEETVRPVDAVLYVPSSPAKIKGRGFDQMQLIAAAFSEAAGLPLWGDLLVKTKEPGAMRRLSAEERRQAVRGVYEVRDPGQRLEGARALLLDDVYTTGSTVDACAAALTAAGAAAVYVLTFAAGGDFRPEEDESRQYAQDI